MVSKMANNVCQTCGIMLFARYISLRDALGRPSAACDDRVSCIQGIMLIRFMNFLQFMTYKDYHILFLDFKKPLMTDALSHKSLNTILTLDNGHWTCIE